LIITKYSLFEESNPEGGLLVRKKLIRPVPLSTILIPRVRFQRKGRPLRPEKRKRAAADLQGESLYLREIRRNCNRVS